MRRIRVRLKLSCGIASAIGAVIVVTSLANPDPGCAEPISNTVVRPIAAPSEKPGKPPPRIHTVEIFVTSWCPICKDLEAFLRTYNIPHIRFDVEHSAKGIEIYQQLGGGGVPITRIDGKKIIRGFFEGQLKRELGIDTPQSKVVVSALNVEYPRDLVER